MSETRAALAYCPYCGDEDLHPVVQTESPGPARGQRPQTPSTPNTRTESPGWECRSCLRVFRVSLLGLAPRPFIVPPPALHETQE